VTHCPRCHQPLARNTASFPGRTILGCRSCRLFAVEVPGAELAWIPGGPGWLERLMATVGEQERRRDIVDSDDDDPRWTRMRI
jgi:hypothetical protein